MGLSESIAVSPDGQIRVSGGKLMTAYYLCYCCDVCPPCCMMIQGGTFDPVYNTVTYQVGGPSSSTMVVTVYLPGASRLFCAGDAIRVKAELFFGGVSAAGSKGFALWDRAWLYSGHSSGGGMVQTAGMFEDETTGGGASTSDTLELFADFWECWVDYPEQFGDIEIGWQSPDISLLITFADCPTVIDCCPNVPICQPCCFELGGIDSGFELGDDGGWVGWSGAGLGGVMRTSATGIDDGVICDETQVVVDIDIVPTLADNPGLRPVVSVSHPGWEVDGFSPPGATTAAGVTSWPASLEDLDYSITLTYHQCDPDTGYQAPGDIVPSSVYGTVVYSFGACPGTGPSCCNTGCCIGVSISSASGPGVADPGDPPVPAGCEKLYEHRYYGDPGSDCESYENRIWWYQCCDEDCEAVRLDILDWIATLTDWEEDSVETMDCDTDDFDLWFDTYASLACPESDWEQTLLEGIAIGQPTNPKFC